MPMLLLVWMLACSHVYMLEGKRERGEEREIETERETSCRTVPTTAAGVKMWTDPREILTHHEICITQGNY